MKVLLCQDVEKLGWLGDIVEVKSGYARNYLLPYGIATVPSEGNIRSLAQAKAQKAEERKLVRQQLERVVEAVEGAEAVIASKANELGHLFGSVAERDIAVNLRDQGFEIADDMVKLANGHLKEVGTHEITLKLAADLKATVNVVIVAEGVEVAEGAEEAAEESEEEKSDDSDIENTGE